ncbi:hypothetical protein HDV00_010998 [Rhizophlyctis rosea]|nr:hypothetical protein HDV00_010998 [Rhizophlyctis rosea]
MPQMNTITTPNPTPPLANLLPPEMLTHIFNYLRPLLSNLTEKKRFERRMESYRAYRNCALTCKTWSLIALQFVWSDIIADHSKREVQAACGTQFSSFEVVCQKRDAGKIRRVDLQHYNTKSVGQLCAALGQCKNLKIAKLKRGMIGWKDLALLFQGCPQVESLSISLDHKGSWVKKLWEREPVKNQLVAGLQNLKILDIRIRTLEQTSFVDFILANLSSSSTLKALTYSRDYETPSRMRDSQLHHCPPAHLPSTLTFFEYFGSPYRESLDPRFTNLPTTLTTLIIHSAILMIPSRRALPAAPTCIL